MYIYISMLDKASTPSSFSFPCFSSKLNSDTLMSSSIFQHLICISSSTFALPLPYSTY